MAQKMEFACECGRTYIIIGDPDLVRKCPRCGRLMRSLDATQKPPSNPPVGTEPSFEAPAPKPKTPKVSPSQLDETWEYEYKFDQAGKLLKNEPFTIRNWLRKVLTLFFSGKTTRR